MKNTVHTQSPQNVFTRQSYAANGQQPRRGVWQDKYTPTRERAVTPQPVSRNNDMRTHHLNNNTHRSQKGYSRKRKTVPVMLWVKPLVKAELERIAASEGVSVSKAGGTFLERSLQQHVDMHYSALLQPIIECAIQKHMRSYSTRLAVLLVRSLFTSEQTRSLATNVLGRQPGITPKELNEILDGSSRAAKRNITHVTPQLTALIEEVEKWLGEGEKPHV
jgi:hypothetical protein